MTLTLALRTRTRHDTRATQREVRVAERKAGDVGQATVEGGDEARTLASFWAEVLGWNVFTSPVLMEIVYSAIGICAARRRSIIASLPG